MKIKNKINTRFHLLFIPFLLLSFSSSINNTNLQNKSVSMHSQTKRKLLYVEGSAENTTAEIRLNDIPIGYLSSKGDSEMKHIAVELNIVAGINRLSVYPSSNKGNIAVRLVRYTEGDWVDGEGGETLLVIRTENDDKPIHKEVTLSKKKPHWAWLDADIISDQESHKEAIAFAISYYNKLKNAKDIEGITEAMKPIYLDTKALSPEITIDYTSQEYKNDFLRISKDTIWKFDPIDSIPFKAVSVGNGKLYDLRRTDGSPLMRTSQNSKWNRVTYHNIIGRKNGVWQFYR